MRKIVIATVGMIVAMPAAYAAGPAAFWGPAAAPNGGSYNPNISAGTYCPINVPNCKATTPRGGSLHVRKAKRR